MRRIAILGEDPGRGDPDIPLFPAPEGSTGARLCHLWPGSRSEFLSLPRVNVFRCRRRWSTPAARAEVARLAPLLGSWPRTCGFRDCLVVALGRRVASLALDLPADQPWLSAHETTVADHHGLTVLPLPHLSGRCRWYNESDNRADARAALLIARRWLRHPPQVPATQRLLSADSLRGLLSLILAGGHVLMGLPRISSPGEWVVDVAADPILTSAAVDARSEPDAGEDASTRSGVVP